MDIVKLVEKVATPGTVIPKPMTDASCVKRWGRRRGERALIYIIPNRQNRNRPYSKGITESEWRRAYDRLTTYGQISRKWFHSTLPECNKEGSCNFTTIGGVFELLGLAAYVPRGIYRRV